VSDAFTPVDVPVPERRPGDPRLGHLLGEGVGPERPSLVVLAGFPSDEGVRRNGGRPGAAGGPAAIRRHLYGLTLHAGRHDAMCEILRRTEDLGDVRVTGQVAEDQERLATALAPHLARRAFVILLGGGHETAYGHFLAYAEAGLAPRILNWDAHPDVRELRDGRPHSGSPFRQALDHPSGACRGYRVVGLLPHATARDHLDFVERHGGSWRWGQDLDAGAVEGEYGALDPPAMVSFDLDAVDAAFAPGVSAPAAGGLDPSLWLRAAGGAGRARAVRSAGVVELSPPHDRDGRTARLAAATVWRVLVGLVAREEG
jgi:formiminoglutamase